MNKDKCTKKSDKRVVSFLKWIERYPGWWHLICTPNDENLDLQVMQTIIKKLAEESFYEMIFVLLMVHRNEKFMYHLYQHLLAKVTINKWQTGQKDEIIKDLIDYFE